MKNTFDVDMYKKYVSQYGNVSLGAYAQDCCPPTYPINFGMLDGFRNGELLICGRVSAGGKCCSPDEMYGGFGESGVVDAGIYSQTPNIFYRPSKDSLRVNHAIYPHHQAGVGR